MFLQGVQHSFQKRKRKTATRATPHTITTTARRLTEVPLSLTFNLGWRQDLEPAASGELTPPVPLPEPRLQPRGSGPRRSAWRRNSRLSQPPPPFAAPAVRGPGADSAGPSAPRAWGQGRGQGGLESAGREQRGARPRRISPPPRRVLSRPRAAPGPPSRPGPSRRRDRTKGLGRGGRARARLRAAGERRPRGRRAAPARGSRRQGATRHSPARPRGSSSGLTGSASSTRFGLPPGLGGRPALRRARGPRRSRRRRPLGKVGERHRLRRARAPSPSQLLIPIVTRPATKRKKILM